jgi:hypothetical protein
MTTTTTTTCPAWCTRDHARNEARQRELAIESSLGPDVLEADLASDRLTHSAAMGGPAGYEVQVSFHPTDGLEVVDGMGETMTSTEARAYGQALLAAADKLDEIAAAS